MNLSDLLNGALEDGPRNDLNLIFCEEPVPLDVFVRDKKYMGSPALSPVQFEAVRIAERIFYPELYPVMGQLFDPYWSEPLRMVNFINLQWGKGSGKGHVCRTISLRVAYLLLCLHSPQEYFGMPNQDSIHLLNVAMNAQQAQRAFFDPVEKLVRTSPWFKDKASPTRGAIVYAKNVEAISGHSEAESQEGLNLLLGVADEIDGFRSKEEVRGNTTGRVPQNTVEGILDMMRTSSSTRFPITFKNVRISYPRYLGSMIQRLTAQSREDNEKRGEKSRHYVSGPLPTWDVNPNFSKFEKIAVAGTTELVPEVYVADYEEDAAMAKAKYECKPSKASNPFFRNEFLVRSAFIQTEKQPIEVNYYRSGDSWEVKYDFDSEFKPIKGAQYCMHGDLAVTGDRAGIAMAHVVRKEEFESQVQLESGEFTTVREMRPIVKVDFVFSFGANKGANPPMEIQIRWARELAYELKKRGFRVKRFTFDGFECLSGDTKIPLLDGTVKTMAELEGSEPFWLYSVNSEGRVVPGICTKAWSTGFRDDMLEVTLDNGEIIKATQDHRFMMRDGSYLPARDLKPGDSLMPLYRRAKKVSGSSQDYEQIYHPNADGSGQHWRFTHSMVSRYMYGQLRKGWVTHHKNVNPRDNRPENLIQLSNAQHSRVHARMNEGRFVKLWEDPEWRAAHIARLSKRRKQDMAGKSGKDSIRYNHAISFETIDSVAKDLVAQGKLTSWRDVAVALGCDQVVIYSRIKEAGFSSWKEYKWSIKPQSYSAKATMKSRKKLEPVNHKVVAIRTIPGEKVYDLQVEKYHNFATEAGVFVHNSRDSMQILEKSGIESKRVSTDRTNEPWRNLMDVMYDGRLLAIHRELLVDELLGLTVLPNGKIDHPRMGSKDEADAMACAVFGAVEQGGRENEAGETAFYQKAQFFMGEKVDLPVGLNHGMLNSELF
jgi:hypothetical protein